MDVTIHNGTTMEPNSTIKAITSQTLDVDFSHASEAFASSQVTSDDGQSLTNDFDGPAPTDIPYMFSTSMAPPKTSRASDVLESLETPYPYPLSVKLEESVSATTLPDFDISEFGTEMVDERAEIRGDVVRGEPTTAVPTTKETPMENPEDSSIIEVDTILPDILLSASPSTKPMFAIGKTEEAVLVGVKTERVSDPVELSTVDPFVTSVIPDSRLYTVEVSQSSTEQTIGTTGPVPTTFPKSATTVFPDYEDGLGSEGNVMAEPSPHLFTQKYTSTESEPTETSIGVTSTAEIQPGKTPSKGISIPTQNEIEPFTNSLQSGAIELTDHASKSQDFTVPESTQLTEEIVTTTSSPVDVRTSHEEADPHTSEAPKETLTEAKDTITDFKTGTVSITLRLVLRCLFDCKCDQICVYNQIYPNVSLS